MIGPVFIALCLQTAAVDVVEHDVTVALTPAAGEIEITDRLKLPAALKSFTLELHAGLAPTFTGARVTSEDKVLGRYTLERDADVVVVSAKGRIVQAPVQAATEHQRSFQETSGTIEARGVYLAPSSRWLPVVVDDKGAALLVKGAVTVGALPAGWSALCEGALDNKTNTWRESKALEGFHLIAGPFSKTQETKRGVDVMIWLRQHDGTGLTKNAPDAAALADRYLEVTGQYLEQYENLIGKYPYAKFALVENFWETGYGMPSFTLLGTQVLRFPFILHTSWPHELLHNWWGNGVFVSSGPGAGGNWSEGLTAYLADHLNSEQQGKGAEYRRTSLQRYLDFVDVDAGKDFPLTEFGGRDSAASEAVGYGKTLMLFHMVRRQIGDAAFTKGLQTLWTTKQQQRASFDDVAAAFSSASGSDLAPFFAAWTTQKGIPTLALRSVGESRSKSGERTLSVTIEQTQQGAALFPLEVPVVVTTVDGRSVSVRVALKGKSGSATVAVPAAVARVDVDPFFDVFRRLDAAEVPPSLSRALGAQKMVLITPTFATKEEQAAWGDFARAICPGDGPRCVVVDDKSVGTLPADAAVWILGYGSYLRGGPFVFTKPYGLRFDDRGVFPPGAWERVLAAKGTPDRLAAMKVERVDPAATGFAVVVEHPRNPSLAMAFVGSPSTKMIPLLAKKIPHYGKYAYVGFGGDEATNNLKGQWPSSSSSLTFFPKAEHSALALKEPPPLAALPPPFDGALLLETVKALADPRLEGRGRNSEGLKSARTLATVKLANAGIKDAVIACDPSDATVCNVVARLPGTDPSLPRVVLGAHLDHLGKQKKKVFAGADDNASGVAVAIEVARQLKKAPGARGVDVVLFDAEESGRLGSLSYVAHEPPGSIYAMVNLDTVGRLADKKPLLVLDGDSASEWVHVARGVGFTTGINIELAPQGGGASDQQSFIEKGIPAIQLFSGPNADYHQPTDTADKVTSSSLVKAAVVAREIVAYLRDRKEPLSVKGASSSSAGVGERKASLGSVPDMSFAGPGVRFDDVVKGSPAELAGLQKGDVLVRFDGAPVSDLKSYSDLLKTKKPGDKVKIVVQRNGKDVAVDVVLAAR
ncbi:MAG: M20/M25/M40 family metallo-hydrolase [Deltaproteobacteria bacterium]|nr:M20/M25/M40 family metallo-hydrolase [Deltaproteobacteria bacterium]